MKANIVAFYLPQYHPTAENNAWWGKGFTEWTCVAQSRALYCHHRQPNIPADLGFYDLRLPEVRAEQAQLAREAGIAAFCYWHYWMGGGKRLLNDPLDEVVRLGEPDFPFCLAWANHPWMRKNWNAKVSRFCQKMLIDQTYPGQQDVDDHFYTMLPAFRDKRYYRVDGRLLFLIYDPLALPEPEYFMQRWQELAQKEGLPGFFFIAQGDSKMIDNPIYDKFDAVNFECIRDFFNESRLRRIAAYTLRHPITRAYKDILRAYDLQTAAKPNVCPTLYPNWDTSPRRGYIATVFHNSTPELFEKHIRQVINATTNPHKLLFLKSWNEWGEGNYVEPDLLFGHGWLDAIARAQEPSHNEEG